MAGLFFIFVTMNKYLIVGLGNTGMEYAHTRHNIGFDVVDAFVRKQAISFHIDRLAEAAEMKIKGRPVICIKPSTYMNLSGISVRELLGKYELGPESLLVLFDERDLPWGMSGLTMRPRRSTISISPRQNSERVRSVRHSR